MSAPSSYSMKIRAVPWLEEEVTSFRPARFSSSRSSGAVIAVSTSSAVAPVQAIRTVMKLTSKFGKNCVFSRVRAAAPTSSMIAISRLQATGWLANAPMRPARGVEAGGAGGAGDVVIRGSAGNAGYSPAAGPLATGSPTPPGSLVADRPSSTSTVFTSAPAAEVVRCVVRGASARAKSTIWGVWSPARPPAALRFGRFARARPHGGRT